MRGWIVFIEEHVLIILITKDGAKLRPLNPSQPTLSQKTLRSLILVALIARLVANYLQLKTFFRAGLSPVMLSIYMAVNVILSVK